MAAAVARIGAAFAGGSLAARAAAAAAPDCVVHASCTMNNIHVTVANLEGQVVSRASGGTVGQKHRARASPTAALDVASAATAKAVEAGHKVGHVHLRGPSRARGQLLRGIQTAGMRIFDIKDVTPMPTNGCRPKAARRL
jgi:small subunit ribosomal protein S11